jgi:hypothetical protein
MSDFINLVIFFTAILMWWKYIKHHHTWTGWTDWVENRGSYDDVTFIRERYCLTCKNKDRHVIGEHRCTSTKYEACPHREVFVAAFDKDVAIENLEKELGL